MAAGKRYDWLAPQLILQSSGSSTSGSLPAYTAPGDTFHPGNRGSYWAMFCTAPGYLASAANGATAPTATSASFPIPECADFEPSFIQEGTQFAFISVSGTATIGWVRCFPAR